MRRRTWSAGRGRRLQLLQALVDDLLDLAAGKSDFRRAERRPVGLSAMVAEIASRFETRAKEKGTDADVAVPEATLDVFSDPADIDRMVTNLVSNAVKYTPSGRVTVRLSEEGAYARLVVSDTGIGIAADALRAGVRGVLPREQRQGGGGGGDRPRAWRS